VTIWEKNLQMPLWKSLSGDFSFKSMSKYLNYDFPPYTKIMFHYFFNFNPFFILYIFLIRMNHVFPLTPSPSSTELVEGWYLCMKLRDIRLCLLTANLFVQEFNLPKLKRGTLSSYSNITPNSHLTQSSIYSDNKSNQF
jgi:hypothetical protein